LSIKTLPAIKNNELRIKRAYEMFIPINMNLQLNCTYNFKIVSSQTTSEGKSFSIVQDEFGKTHFYSKQLFGESIKLTVKNYSEGK
jgi:hypothetical protein